MSQRPIFAPDRDSNLVSRQTADLHRAAYPKIALYKRNRDEESFDELYGDEEIKQLLSGSRYDIPCQRTINPPARAWEKWGITSTRDIALSFSVDVLRRGYVPVGETVPVPFPYIEIGDLVVVLGRMFMLKDAFRRSFHGGSERPFRVDCFGLTVRSTWDQGSGSGPDTGGEIDIGGDTDVLIPPGDGGDDVVF
jgi:hypothetical protein